MSYIQSSGGASTNGIYTPTLTGVANIGAVTAYSCQYFGTGTSSGDMITVSGKLDIDVTLTATLTQVGISLPVASNFAAANQCGGAASCISIAGLTGGIIGDATNDRAELDFISTDINNDTWSFTFTYRIV